MSFTDFTGKRSLIREQFERFLRQEGAEDDANAYLNQIKGHQYRAENGVKAKTSFTNADKNGQVKKFAASENVLLIGNRESFSVDQYPREQAKSAGMSMIHIFAISKANYFNAVSLKPEDAFIIDEMIEFFKTQWERPKFREDVLQYQRDAIKNRGTKTQEGLNQWEELKGIIHELKPDDFAFGFHLFPDNSVPHLHMHIIAMPEKFRRYSTRLNDEKTKDALEVRDEVLRRH